MQANFEIKYLDVSWYDESTVLSIVESFVPLAVEYDEQQQTFTCEALLYPEAPGIKHGQLAFRFLSKNTIEPYFELADGSRVGLKKLLMLKRVKYGGLKLIVGLQKIKFGKERLIAPPAK